MKLFYSILFLSVISISCKKHTIVGNNVEYSCEYHYHFNPFDSEIVDTTYYITDSLYYNGADYNWMGWEFPASKIEGGQEVTFKLSSESSITVKIKNDSMYFERFKNGKSVQLIQNYKCKGSE